MSNKTDYDVIIRSLIHLAHSSSQALPSEPFLSCRSRNPPLSCWNCPPMIPTGEYFRANHMGRGRSWPRCAGACSSRGGTVVDDGGARPCCVRRAVVAGCSVDGAQCSAAAKLPSRCALPPCCRMPPQPPALLPPRYRRRAMMDALDPKAVRLETAIAILAAFFMVGLGDVPGGTMGSPLWRLVLRQLPSRCALPPCCRRPRPLPSIGHTRSRRLCV
jgi:hypothetical protein